MLDNMQPSFFLFIITIIILIQPVYENNIVPCQQDANTRLEISPTIRNKYCSACNERCDKRNRLIKLNTTSSRGASVRADADGASRADPVRLPDDPPEWVAVYMGPKSYYLKDGNYLGMITRVSDNVFLAHWFTINQVDSPPNGCEYAVGRVLGPEAEGSIRSIYVAFDPAVSILPFDASQYRTFTAGEVYSLDAMTRLYEFRRTRTKINSGGIDYNLFPDFLHHVQYPPEIPSSDQDNFNSCLLLTYKSSIPGKVVWDFVKIPVTLEGVAYGRKVIKIKSGPHTYCEIDRGAPVVCDGKLAYISHGESGCKSTFFGTILAPWKSEIERTVRGLKPKVDYPTLTYPNSTS